MSSGWRTTPLAHGCDTPHHCPLPLRLGVLAHAPYFAGLDRAAVAAVEQRVASTLLALADKVGEPRGRAVLLQLPLSRADLAAMTGTTTESVSRTLSKLRRQGVVETGRRWTAVTDREALAALVAH